MCVGWCSAGGGSKKAIVILMVKYAYGVVLADLLTGPIFSVIPADSQKDDWFINVVLKYPTTKNISVSA